MGRFLLDLDFDTAARLAHEILGQTRVSRNLADQPLDNVRIAAALLRSVTNSPARVSLASEMSQSNRNFAYRVAAEACIMRRLDELETVIEETAKLSLSPVSDW